jgi:hypothetical protein
MVVLPSFGSSAEQDISRPFREALSGRFGDDLKLPANVFRKPERCDVGLRSACWQRRSSRSFVHW